MKEKQNIEEVDWILVGKYLAGEATPAEIKKIESWRNQSKENQTELLENSRMLEKIDAYYQSKKFDSSAAWKKVEENAAGLQTKTVQFDKRKAFSRFYKYAAIILFAVTLGIAGYYAGFRAPGIHLAEVVSAEKQVIEDFVLPDGSVVTLNANSKLVYPEKFDGETREVTIVGEAFFDVERNPEKPFIIHAGNAQVKVLGTSFYVQAYPGNERVEVVVETGRVQVAPETEEKLSGQDEIVLTPGEKGTYTENKLEKMVSTDQNSLAWKTRNLVFNETPLGEVANYLQKVYHVDIHISEEELKNLPLTATFNKKPIDFVLNVIQLTFDLEMTTKDDLFILSIPKNEQVKL